MKRLVASAIVTIPEIGTTISFHENTSQMAAIRRGKKAGQKLDARFIGHGKLESRARRVLLDDF